jgi:hypothetical protein
MQSPWIDASDEATTYRLAPGRHVILWTSTPYSYAGAAALVSNTLTIDVE